MKQFILLVFVLAATFSTTFAQAVEKAPIPVMTEGDKAKQDQLAKKQQATTPKVEEVVEKSNAKMTFETLTVDYGTIAHKSEPLRTVKFTNTGTDPLIIKNAQGSCGCTVPVWPKEAIMPGESSVIEVRYDTNRVGRINKSITITTNEGPDKHILQVVGEILKAEEEMAVPASSPNIIKG